MDTTTDEAGTARDARMAFVEHAFRVAGLDDFRLNAAPCLLLAGTPTRLIWANQHAAALFDARTYAELETRVLRSDAASARRLSSLAEHLAAGATPRLERLRFAWGFRSHSLTLSCGRPALDTREPMLAIAAAEDAGVAAPWYLEPAGTPAQSLVSEREQTAPRPPDHASGAPEDGLDARPPAAPDTPRGSGPVRFLWRTDGSGRVVEIDAGALDRNGVDWSPLGRDLPDSVSAFDPAAADALRAVLGATETWLGVAVRVPLAGVGARLPVVLSGSPVLEGRTFAGFRGFGRFTPVMPEGRLAGPATDEAAPAGRSGVNPELPAESEAPPTPDAASDASSGPAEASVPTREDEDRREAPPTSPSNVVQLRPPPPRPPVDGMEAPRGLSDTEQVAFQEIGRALTAVGNPGPDRQDALRPDPQPGLGDTDAIIRGAATVAERTSALLLVVRQPRVLFSNDALLTRLRFDDQDMLADALGLHFARYPAPPATSDDGSAPQTIALRLPTADAGLVDFRAVARPVAWADGPATLYTIEPARDTAAREGVRGAAEPGDEIPTDADLATLVAEADDPTVQIDAAGLVLARNRRSDEWFGPAATRGASLASVLAQESRAAFDGRLAELRAGSATSSTSEMAARRLDGVLVPLRLTIIRLPQDRFVVSWRDLSAERDVRAELAQLRHAAERANAEQPEFLAKVSDEIRTPLNAILGFAEIMMDERFGPLGNPRYKDYLHDIHASGRQVVKLVDDLVDLSTIQSGRADIDLDVVDINRVSAECVAEGQPEAHRARVIVRTSLGARVPPVRADGRSLRQIIANLLSNAIKFNEPGGQVIVSSAASDDGTVMLRIRDTGVGMTDAEIAAALEPLRRIDSARTGSGAGLGLSIAKALVMANGASLAIRSRPGEGTMVEVTFPAAAPQVARVQAS